MTGIHFTRKGYQEKFGRFLPDFLLRIETVAIPGRKYNLLSRNSGFAMISRQRIASTSHRGIQVNRVHGS